MTQINSYLTFNGNCSEAMTFYKENVEQDELTIHINYLSAFDQDNYDFLEESLPIILFNKK